MGSCAGWDSVNRGRSVRLPAGSRLLDAADRTCAARARCAANAAAAGPRPAVHQRQDRPTKKAESRQRGGLGLPFNFVVLTVTASDQGDDPCCPKPIAEKPPTF